MCKQGETREVNVRGKSISVDACLAKDIEALLENGITTLGCCCGHGRYPKTIVCRDEVGAFEYFTGIRLGQKTRNFYRRDADGHFFLPEVRCLFQATCNGRPTCGAREMRKERDGSCNTCECFKCPKRTGECC